MRLSKDPKLGPQDQELCEQTLEQCRSVMLQREIFLTSRYSDDVSFTQLASEMTDVRSFVLSDLEEWLQYTKCYGRYFLDTNLRTGR